MSSSRRFSSSGPKLEGSDKPVRTGLPRPWSKSGKGGRIRIRWRLLGLYLASGAVLLWAIFSTALYFFIKNRSGFTEVRYAHVAGLPFTLDAYREAKGEFWVREGLKNAQDGEWRRAFDQLRMGLPYAPENEEARLTLARIYLMAGRPDLAGPVLVEGLDQHSNQADYLRSVISFLFGQQADAAVVEVANKLLAESKLDPRARRIVAVARMYAYFNRDQFEEVAKSIQTESLDESVEASFIRARMAWETGIRETAIVMLRDLHNRAPKDGEIYRTLILYLWELDRFDDARRVALARQWDQPAVPDSYVDYIALCHVSGESSRANQAIDDFLGQFKDRPFAMLQLATWAAKEGRPDLVWRVAGLCGADLNAASQATLLGIEAEIKRGNYLQALQKVAEFESGRITWSESQSLTLIGLEGVAQLALGQASEAQARFGRLITAPKIAPATLASIAVSAAKLGDELSARRLLQRALDLDPLNQPALVELLRLELKNHALDRALSLVKRLPDMRKPPNELMSSIIKNLESDRYLFLADRRSAIDGLQARLDAVRYAPRA